MTESMMRYVKKKRCLLMLIHLIILKRLELTLGLKSTYLYPFHFLKQNYIFRKSFKILAI